MGSNYNHNNQILKGKRTKRQRSLSPFGLTAGTVTASGSSSSSGDGDGGGGGAGGERGVVDDFCYYYNNNNNNNSASSPTTSGEIYKSTEEEDMANCLIMLAQGDGPRLQIQDTLIKTEKLSSRRFSGLVTTSSTTKAAGFYVYECKTCNRSFPSFQALGGHRASHKKPKAMVEDQKKTSSSSMVFLPLKEDMEEATTPPPPPPPLPSVDVSMQVGVNATTKASKIHECSICGSEFTSGQALGGHMRRHRAATGNNNNINKVVMMTSDVDANTATIVESERRSILPLDLNLPAPEDDHLRDSKFQFGSSTQQAHSLVFSAPALVDCHY